MIVKNEDRFVWYAIASVISYVDKFIIYDTGSMDNTVAVIRSFHDSKIGFKQFQIKDINEIAKIRDRQIRESKNGWFWIIDGDEIYSDELCREVTEIIRKEGDDLEGIVVGRYDLLGDVYHFQDETVGTYEMFGKKGHMALRLINSENISGLHVSGNYPYEEYFDNSGKDLIFHEKEKFRFTKGKLFHAMYLQRSSIGANLSDTYHRKKWKVELGHRFSSNVKLPEIFTAERPTFVPDVTKKRSLFYEAGAVMVTPIKVLKRKFG